MKPKKIDTAVNVLFSARGRASARCKRKFSTTRCRAYGELVGNIEAGDIRSLNEKLWEPSSWPRQAQDVGFMEVPRGGLAPLDRHRRRKIKI